MKQQSDEGVFLKYLWKCQRVISFYIIFRMILLPTIAGGKSHKRKKDVTSVTGDDRDEDQKKKMRTTFTGKQIFELEKCFESKKYQQAAERAEMAAGLEVTQQQVDINFILANLIY